MQDFLRSMGEDNYVIRISVWIARVIFCVYVQSIYLYLNFINKYNLHFFMLT